MHNLKTEGIIIKRRNFNEADRMITVLTRDFGKLSIKATGVRRITSRRSSHIELLNHTELSLYNGRSMPTLIEAQTINSFPNVKDDLTKTGFAYHICELIDGLCAEEQEQPSVFFLVKRTLERLSSQEDSLLVIHEFEIELLTLLGFWHKKAEDSKTLDTHHFIENILERKLKSHNIFAKIHREDFAS